MGIFPDRKPKGKDGAELIFGDRMKDASEGQKVAANLVLDYIKLGHQIIKAVFNKDKTEADRVSDIIVAKIQNVNWEDEAQRAAVISVILTAASGIPPAAYGEDTTKWGNDDDRN